jgi:SAM-dependent methyltransferase
VRDESDGNTADSRQALMRWLNDEKLSVGDTLFSLSADRSELVKSEPNEFVLVKTRSMIEAFIREAPERVENVIDLGIFKGGSVLFLQEMFRPRRLVGLDLYRLAPRAEPLESRIAQQELSDAIRLYYEIDQGDHIALERIMKENFPEGKLDLVIDDCSHLYAPTKASLNFLLPRVRPLGLYVIEDWGWAHWPGEEWQGPHAIYGDETTPLSILVMELVMTAASRNDIIGKLTITSDSVYITKGWPATDPEGFDISTCYLNRGKRFPLELERESLRSQLYRAARDLGKRLGHP